MTAEKSLSSHWLINFLTLHHIPYLYAHFPLCVCDGEREETILFRAWIRLDENFKPWIFHKVQDFFFFFEKQETISGVKLIPVAS